MQQATSLFRSTTYRRARGCSGDRRWSCHGLHGVWRVRAFKTRLNRRRARGLCARTAYRFLPKPKQTLLTRNNRLFKLNWTSCTQWTEQWCYCDLLYSETVRIVEVNKNRSCELSNECEPCDYGGRGEQDLYVHLSYFNFIVTFLIIGGSDCIPRGKWKMYECTWKVEMFVSVFVYSCLDLM